MASERQIQNYREKGGDSFYHKMHWGHTPPLEVLENKGKKDKQVEKTGKICTHGSLSGQRLKNKENELYHQIMKSKEHSEKSCVNGAKRREVLSSPRMKDTCVYTWVKQCWSVASCPEEWKYPLAVCLELMQLSPRREC